MATIEINQGVVGRIFRMGTVKITSRGIDDVVFKRVKDPMSFRRHIESVSSSLRGVPTTNAELAAHSRTKSNGPNRAWDATLPDDTLTVFARDLKVLAFAHLGDPSSAIRTLIGEGPVRSLDET